MKIIFFALLLCGFAAHEAQAGCFDFLWNWFGWGEPKPIISKVLNVNKNGDTVTWELLEHSGKQIIEGQSKGEFNISGTIVYDTRLYTWKVSKTEKLGVQKFFYYKYYSQPESKTYWASWKFAKYVDDEETSKSSGSKGEVQEASYKGTSTSTGKTSNYLSFEILDDGLVSLYGWSEKELTIKCESDDDKAHLLKIDNKAKDEFSMSSPGWLYMSTSTKNPSTTWTETGSL